VKRNWIFCLWAANTILCVVLFAPTTLRAEESDEQDSLTVVEENYAYDTKVPSQRVKAFLKVAESKVQQVKENVRRGSTEVLAPFSGYSTAIKGAWMGVSWGQALRSDMTDSVRAIQRTTQKHVDTLRKLQATASPSQREALAQILSIVLRIQNSEPTGLYARK
jgi:hypothetical protein